MHVSDNGVPYSPELAQQPSGKSAISVSDILGILLRKWIFLVLGTAIGLGIATTYFVVKKRSYWSTARVLIDRSISRYLQSNNIVQVPTFYYDVSSQIYILQSERVILPVVRSLHLDKDPEFVTVAASDGSAGSKKAEEDLWTIGGLKSRSKELIKKALGWNSDAPPRSPEEIATAAVLSHLSVTQATIPSVVNISFESRDPVKAARIANAIGDTFIELTQTIKIDSTKVANRFLAERLLDLKKQIVAAEIALDEYKNKHNLVELKTANLSAEKLANLSSHLAKTHIALVEARARLDRINKLTDEGAPIALFPDNKILLELRSRYLDMSAQLKELEGRVGPNHTAVKEMQKRIADLQNSINEEKERITATYTSEYQLSKDKSAELSAELSKLVKKSEVRYQAQVKMRELESKVETLRNLYNSVFQKSSTMPGLDQFEEARMIDRATPPPRRLMSKKTLAIFGGSIIFGLLLGAGVAVGRELGPGAFRAPREVRQLVAAPCAVLPFVQRKSGLAALFSRGNRNEAAEHWVNYAPFSRFAEGIREIESSFLPAVPARRENVGKVVGIVSCVAREGKTTVASNLYASLGRTSSSRVLVIDGDLHGRGLTGALAPDADKGLVEVLKDRSQFNSAVMKTEGSTVDFLPCVLPENRADAARMLGSAEMAELVDIARQRYDLVIIEIAPVASVVDVRMIKPFVDSFVFVIEWGKTKRRLVEEVLADMEFIGDRLACTVLNKADPAALKYIESYKGDRFNKYYVG